MTAAIAELVRPIPGFGLRGVSARLLTVLAVALPVPVFAAVGRSLPLPSTVERIAAKLVPFSNSSTVDLGGVTQPLVRGSIVLAPETTAAAPTPERAVQPPRPSAPAVHHRVAHHAAARPPERIAPRSKPTYSTPAPATEADIPAASPPQRRDDVSLDEPKPSHAPPDGSTGSPPAPDAVGAATTTVTTATDTVEADVTGAADSVGAGSVTSTVTDATTTVTDTVITVTDPVTTTVATTVDSSVSSEAQHHGSDHGSGDNQGLAGIVTTLLGGGGNH
jgi:hypothetical protein